MITGTDFVDGNIDFSSIKYISKYRYEQDKNIQINNNDILITKDGSIGKVAIVKNMTKPATLNAGVYRIRTKRNDIESEYLYQYLSAPFLLNFASKQSSGGTIKHLNQSQIVNFKIPFTALDEQKKISSLLLNIDTKIRLLSDKITTLKKYKKGIMQKTFKSGKKLSLGSILKEINIKATQNNQYEILSSTAVGLFNQKEYFNHQVASENNIGYKIIKKGELLFSPQNLWLGNINLNMSFDIGIVSPSYKVYSIDNRINKIWLIELLKTPKMLYNYKLVSEQGASVVRRNLDIQQFMEITINIPLVQDSIGNALESLQNKINALSTSLEHLKKLKMHLLDSLFI